MTTDLTPSDLSHLSDDEFNALCPHDGHAPGPEPLSPVAQAVLTAATQRLYCLDPEDVPLSASEHGSAIAAALRAAADQGESLYDPHEGKVSVVRVEHLRAIAAELEGAQ